MKKESMNYILTVRCDLKKKVLNKQRKEVYVNDDKGTTHVKI